jgi:hypothetical protein
MCHPIHTLITIPLIILYDGMENDLHHTLPFLRIPGRSVVFTHSAVLHESPVSTPNMAHNAFSPGIEMAGSKNVFTLATERIGFWAMPPRKTVFSG